ncbi:cysteine desulfurase family protein [Bacillaceae bacterium W0354]
MIYLDNSATTKPDEEVLKAFYSVSTHFFANPSSIHFAGGQVEKLMTKAREQIANILNIKPSEVIFTSGGTESNNLAIKGIAYRYKNRGNHIITSEIEHPSVLEVCKRLETEGFQITYLSVNQDGQIDINELKNKLTDDTILVTLMHVNNEIGSIQPIEAVAKLLNDYPKVFFHVDHVQGFGKIPIKYEMDGIDLVTISGHKIHGLKGTGCLIKKENVRLEPMFQGGFQESGNRPGTENVAGAVSLAKAIRLASEKLHNYEQLIKYKEKIKKSLESINVIEMNSPSNGAAHIINFSVNNFKPEVLIHALGEKEIYVSTKSACSSKQNEPSHVIQSCFKDEKRAASAIRVSMNMDQSENDIDLFLTELQKIIKKYEHIMG